MSAGSPNDHPNTHPTNGSANRPADWVTEAAQTELLTRLDALEAESRARADDLRQLLTEIPDAVSRRAMVRTMATDIRALPELSPLAKAVALRVSRRPIQIVRGVQRRALQRRES